MISFLDFQNTVYVIFHKCFMGSFFKILLKAANIKSIYRNRVYCITFVFFPELRNGRSADGVRPRRSNTYRAAGVEQCRAVDLKLETVCFRNGTE